jgi:hypothetical protein
MRENRLTIRIQKSIHEVFKYTITPPNTKFWVDSIVDEKTSEWPVRVGTVYQEQMKSGGWENYKVVDFKENRVFELVSTDGNYHARYTYEPLGNSVCVLVYYEWVDLGDLKDPFNEDTLVRLKSLLESFV